MKKHRLLLGVAAAATGVISGACSGAVTGRSTPAPPSTSAPASPPVEWCTSGFADPYTKPPAGAVTIPAGDDSHTAIVTNYTIKPRTVYWFAAGVHTLGSGQFAQIPAAPGDTFVGAPGAILDGEGQNAYAFVTNSNYKSSADTGVTIEYLTVRHFVAGEGSSVVGQGGYNSWTIKDNLIERNPNGAGVALGSNSTVTDNCLTNNGEYGFNSFQSTNVTLTGNEISFNDAGGKYDHPGGTGCGCAGGGKFWQTKHATVTGNYVHDNGDPGLWVDTDNAGFNISGNYVANNYAEGIMYEISYNARIVNNTLIGNDVGAGKANSTPDFPGSAIYISESGSDTRVSTLYSQQTVISDNVLTNNWGGITLYENANRACGLSADQVCTLVDPSVYTLASCKKNLPTAKPTGRPDYFDNCRWKTQNIIVEHNMFTFNPSKLGTACITADANPSSSTGCGFNGLFSVYGSTAPYKAWVVPNNISNHQNDHFTDNTYQGPWKFVGFNQGNLLTWTQWHTGTANNEGSGDPFAAQDAGSTFSSTP